MKHFEFEISQLVDGEMEASAKKDLFLHLSECADCQKALSEYLAIKEKSKDFFAEKTSASVTITPAFSIDEAYAKIAAQKRVGLFYKSLSAVSSAAALLLLVLTMTHEPAAGPHLPTGSNAASRSAGDTNSLISPNREQSDKDYLKYALGLRAAKIESSEIIEVIKRSN